MTEDIKYPEECKMEACERHLHNYEECNRYNREEKEDAVFDYSFPNDLREALYKRMLAGVHDRAWENKEDYVRHMLVSVEDEVHKYLESQFEKEEGDGSEHIPDESA